MSHDRITLVVDDDPDIRDCVGELLKDEGYEVRTAADGREALTWLRALGDDRCVLVLDLMMPGMSGFEVLDVLGREGRLPGIPVIVCSANLRAGPLPRELHAVLEKPLSFDALVAALESAGCRRHSHVRPCAPRVDDAPSRSNLG